MLKFNYTMMQLQIDIFRDEEVWLTVFLNDIILSIVLRCFVYFKIYECG